MKTPLIQKDKRDNQPRNEPSVCLGAEVMRVRYDRALAPRKAEGELAPTPPRVVSWPSEEGAS